MSINYATYAITKMHVAELTNDFSDVFDKCEAGVGTRGTKLFINYMEKRRRLITISIRFNIQTWMVGQVLML